MPQLAAYALQISACLGVEFLTIHFCAVFVLGIPKSDFLPGQGIAAQISFRVKEAIVQVRGDAKLVIGDKNAHIVPVKALVAGVVALGYKEWLLKIVIFPKGSAGAAQRLLHENLFRVSVLPDPPMGRQI